MIHKLAIVHESARIADDVEIGPWSIIGANVEIDAGTWVGPHVVINGPTKIGKNNRIFQFASIGEISQDKKFILDDTESYLEVGDGNTIREYCTFNRGTAQGGGATRVGNNNWFMANTHIAHDCIVGNENIFANNVALAGHVIVGNYVGLGGYVGVHQFCNLGDHCFVAKASYVTKDVLPYLMIAGHSPSATGLNLVGLKRRNFSTETIEQLKRAYKIIFRQGLTVKQAIAELEVLLPECREIQPLIDMLAASNRGIVR
ncbi:MAG: acyl-ACP--UDP-N-acetylglucosamine O-acyltransferase [Gammaproteobacteria bacterium]